MLKEEELVARIEMGRCQIRKMQRLDGEKRKSGGGCSFLLLALQIATSSTSECPTTSSPGEPA
jgi:hypothetical protein